MLPRPNLILTKFFLFKRTVFHVMQNNIQNHSSEIFWDPMKIIRPPSDYNYALAVLNRPIILKQDFVLPLWEKGKYYGFLSHYFYLMI